MTIKNRGLTNPTTTLESVAIPSVSIQVLKNELAVSSNEIIQRVINNLIVEFDATGQVSEESASNLIGNRPKPPKDSADTQFIDAWILADREYEKKLRFIRQYIAKLVAEAKS